MKNLSLSLFIILSVSAICHAQEATHTSTFTFGVGGGWPVKNSSGTKGGPVFNANYEFRLSKHWAIESGVDTTLGAGYFYNGGIVSIIDPNTFLVSSSGYLNSYTRGTARSVTVPFGFRRIQPVAQGKGELFVGLGGAYHWSSEEFSYRAWDAQGSLGARFALDKHRHFWMGTTGRFSRDFTGYNREGWATWTADLSYRFGK